MYGDFSRLTYSPGKAYTGVWSQQGRVQLDADANEQTAILLDWLRTLAIDFIGPFGGHVKRAGFHVEVNGSDLTFSPGHYYVYGLRCEVPEPAGPDDPAATYRGLVPAASSLPVLVQLLVWERSVSAVIDDSLLEPALGPHPPDTTVRTQVAWSPMVSSSLPAPDPDGTALADVKAADLNAEYISANFEEYNARGRTLPLLAAGVGDNEGEAASIVPATSGYLGTENQLYRLEVHMGGTVAAGDLRTSGRVTTAPLSSGSWPSTPRKATSRRGAARMPPIRLRTLPWPRSAATRGPGSRPGTGLS